MAYELLDTLFIPLFLIAGFSLKLWSNRGASDGTLKYYWLTVISTLVLLVADSLESWSQLDPDRRFWRILFSVVGYTMRPVAALSIVLIIYPQEYRPSYLWIPCMVNMLVYSTAFFAPIAFGYSEQYGFVRGPLGYTVFVISFLYIVLCIWQTWRRFRDKDHSRERFVLYICAFACVAAALLDMETGGTHLNAVILISSVFLYMFLRSFDMNRDPLTGLLNRMAFFADSAKYSTAVSAVVSADMNGLKRINDVVGHEAGDEALKVIGRSMQDVTEKNILAYRIGGDEFALLFIRQDEEKVKQVIEKMDSLITAKGYSVSTGYAMRGNTFASIQDLIRWADENMYASKANYYKDNSHNRRKNGNLRESAEAFISDRTGPGTLNI